MRSSKNVVIISPQSVDGSPVSQRISSINKYLKTHDIRPLVITTRYTIRDSIKILVQVYTAKYDAVIITMPPFRIWHLVFLLRTRVILDWRDGWSFAIINGYGGSTRKRPWVGAMAKFVEKLSVKSSQQIVTCTPGLFSFHTKNSFREEAEKIILIPNGHDYEIDRVRFRPFDKLTDVNAVCLGKFSEYGPEKITHLIEVFGKRYSGKILIDVYGADYESNKWLTNRQYINGRISFNINPRIKSNQIEKILKNYDLGIAIVRDESYELGTKSFQYLALGLPIFDMFQPQSQYKTYFGGAFDSDYDPEIAFNLALEYRRSEVLKKYGASLIHGIYN